MGAQIIEFPASRRVKDVPDKEVFRLTTRGRVVLWGLGIVTMTMVLVLGVTVFGQNAQAGRESNPGAVQVITVTEGQTLWEFAERMPGDGDRRDKVLMLKRMNGLASGELVVGQRVVIPVQ